jgi:hypothetical protein
MTSQPRKKAVRATHCPYRRVHPRRVAPTGQYPYPQTRLLLPELLDGAYGYSATLENPAMRFADHQRSQLPFGGRQRAGTAIEDS